MYDFFDYLYASGMLMWFLYLKRNLTDYKLKSETEVQMSWDEGGQITMSDECRVIFSRDCCKTLVEVKCRVSIRH